MPAATSRTAIMVTCALLLSLALSQSGLTPGPNGFIDAVIDGAPSDPATLVAATRYSFGDTVVGSVPVSVDAGRVLLRGPLPDLSDSPLLLSADAQELWPCTVHVSDANTRFTPVSLALGDLGTLDLIVPPHDDAPLGGDAYLVLVYADAPVRIEGRCDDEQLHVDLMLLPGWGLLASQQLSGADDGWILLRNAAPIESTLAMWTLVAR